MEKTKSIRDTMKQYQTMQSQLKSSSNVYAAESNSTPLLKYLHERPIKQLTVFDDNQKSEARGNKNSNIPSSLQQISNTDSFSDLRGFEASKVNSHSQVPTKQNLTTQSHQKLTESDIGHCLSYE